MSTDSIEVYSLEEGDQILFQGNIYRIVGIEDGENLDYRLILVDEEGFRRHLEAEGQTKLRMVVDNVELFD